MVAKELKLPAQRIKIRWNGYAVVNVANGILNIPGFANAEQTPNMKPKIIWSVRHRNEW